MRRTLIPRRWAAPEVNDESSAATDQGIQRIMSPALKIAFCSLAVLALAAFSACVSGLRGAAQPAKTPQACGTPPGLILAQTPRGGAGAGDDVRPGGRIAWSRSSGQRADLEVLTRDFFAAGRPQLSFDATRVLFLGRPTAADATNVWEMDLGSRQTRQITHAAADCTAAIYLSTLYTITADAPTPQICYCTKEPDDVSALYTCLPDGGGVRRITFGPNPASDPCLLSDGRLLFTSHTASPAAGLDASPQNTNAIGARLFTVNTDGTDVSLFAEGDASAVPGDACETADGRVFFVERKPPASPSGRQASTLVAVARTRSLRTRQVIREFAGPLGRLAAQADGTLWLSTAATYESPGGITLFDPASDRCTMLYESEEWSISAAGPVEARPAPAGRSSRVDDKADYGFLYCLDSYLSDRPEASRIERGQIKRIRVFTSAPAAQREKMLSEFDVETDGSFFLQVPARTPLRLQTIGDAGAVLQNMQSWLWIMPREARGCIGCHEDRELTPPNRHVIALRKPPHLIPGADAQTGPGKWPTITTPIPVERGEEQ
ncbi:MAG: hypothetical protein HZB38_12175 [Planctomycetes bacterium]|nr:hypothetical protein [Planctomycetota bacterium]